MIALLFAFAGIANAQTVVNFEDGQSPSNWSNDATYPWTVVTLLSSTGNYCIQSGNAGVSSSTSSISTSISFASPGYITFEANCMGEGTTTFFDKCIFAIDGETMFEHGKDLEGWHYYGYNLPAGSHTFTWSYTKDSSVNPEGDCFQIDNITFGLGTACVAPSNVVMNQMGIISWMGSSDSFTVRYKKGSGSWTTQTGITENEFDATGLGLHGDYTFEVQADCEPNNWASATFHFAESTAQCYGFAKTAPSTDDNNKYINFSAQNTETVEIVSAVHPEAEASVFANGFVWSVNYNDETSHHMLCKSPINIYEKTIGDPEILNDNFSEVTSMAYNPANGLIYYVTTEKVLKSFNPTNPGPTTEYGTFDTFIYKFAINNAGEAFVIRNDNDFFCSLNLTDLSLTEIGKLASMTCIAFDMETGELFGTYTGKLYYIDGNTAEKTLINTLGTGEYYIRSIFFTYDWDAVTESSTESLNVYPNPANDMLYIDGVEGETVRVYDNIGRLVKQEQYNGHLDVSGLAQGIYAVTVGERTVKFVKK